MATPQENYTAAYTQAYDGIVEEVAIQLKGNWNHIGGAVGGLATPGEDDTYREYARALMESRQFIAPSADATEQKTVSLTSLDEKLKDSNLLNQLGVDSLDSLVPTTQQAEAIAQQIGEAAKENTGTIGFLGGATLSAALRGFFAWIGQVFNWMFNGEKGSQAPGLFETIANVAAQDVRESTQARLETLHQQRPDLRGVLNERRIGAIGEQVYAATLTTGGVDAPAAAPAMTLANVTPAQMDRGNIGNLVYDKARPMAEQQILATIADQTAALANENNSVKSHFGDAIQKMAKDNPAQFKQKLDAFKKGPISGTVAWWKGIHIPSSKGVETLADMVADTLRDVSTGENHSAQNMNAQQFGQAVGEELAKRLQANTNDAGLDFLYLNDTKQSRLGQIQNMVSQMATQQHYDGAFGFIAQLNAQTTEAAREVRVEVPTATPTVSRNPAPQHAAPAGSSVVPPPPPPPGGTPASR